MNRPQDSNTGPKVLAALIFIVFLFCGWSGVELSWWWALPVLVVVAFAELCWHFARDKRKR